MSKRYNIPRLLREPVLLTAALLAEVEQVRVEGGWVPPGIDSELTTNPLVSSLGNFVCSLFPDRPPGELTETVRRVIDTRNQIEQV